MLYNQDIIDIVKNKGLNLRYLYKSNASLVVNKKFCYVLSMESKREEHFGSIIRVKNYKRKK